MLFSTRIKRLYCTIASAATSQATHADDAIERIGRLTPRIVHFGAGQYSEEASSQFDALNPLACQLDGSAVDKNHKFQESCATHILIPIIKSAETCKLEWVVARLVAFDDKLQSVMHPDVEEAELDTLDIVFKVTRLLQHLFDPQDDKYTSKYNDFYGDDAYPNLAKSIVFKLVNTALQKLQVCRLILQSRL